MIQIRIGVLSMRYIVRRDNILSANYLVDSDQDHLVFYNKVNVYTISARDISYHLMQTQFCDLYSRGASVHTYYISSILLQRRKM